ncbi:SET domain-containing protein [Phlegmacium glaucopus]|nr:SET domain-containing protein [Phlegmacium glaucopus]
MGKKKSKNAPRNAPIPTSTTASIFAEESYNLPYGKVENIDLPDGYQEKPLQYREVPASSSGTAAQVDDEDPTLFTTIPGRYRNGDDDPDGHSEWMLRTGTKEKVTRAPGYPQPIPKTSQINYVIKTVPDMGMGMFATRDIEIGELIFSERPLLVIPEVLITSVATEEHYTEAQIQKIMLIEAEKMLEIAFGRMNDKDKKAYMGLMNSHQDDGSGPLMGILRTNRYGLDGLADGPDGAKVTSRMRYSAVCDKGSRINHSCMENITTNFRIPSFSVQFIATKEIKAGEQIFFCYCHKSSSAAERKEELARYGVVCQCSACLNATPERDRLRKEYTRRVNEYARLSKIWIQDSSLDEDVLRPVVKLYNEMKAEGLDTSEHYSLLLGVFYAVYTRLNQREKAAKWADEIKKHTRLTVA